MKNEEINKNAQYKKKKSFSLNIIVCVIDVYLIVAAIIMGYYFFPGIIFFISSIVLIREILKIKKIYNFKTIKSSEYEYWRDTDFKHIEPIYAGYLIGVDKININSIIAELFYLEEKEILDIDLINSEYYISLNTKISEESLNNLKSYESTIINLFFDSVIDNRRINLKEKLKQFDKEYNY